MTCSYVKGEQVFAEPVQTLEHQFLNKKACQGNVSYILEYKTCQMLPCN